ncbi:hypothetical protein PbJCM17693_52570 [Paenibacillus macerans]|nr:hypothetical protein PbJCM17693_52570 [Paenibacillus macerans]
MFWTFFPVDHFETNGPLFMYYSTYRSIEGGTGYGNLVEVSGCDESEYRRFAGTGGGPGEND